MGEHAAGADDRGAVVEDAVLAELAEAARDEQPVALGGRPPAREGRPVERLGRVAGLVGVVEDVARGDELGEHDDVGPRVDRLADRRGRQRAVRLEVGDRGRELAGDDARHGSVDPPGSAVARSRFARTRSPRPGVNRATARPMSSHAATTNGKREYGKSSPKTFL